MTSYKQKYEEIKREYERLRSNSIDLRKPNLRIFFDKRHWEWDESIEPEGIVLRKRPVTMG